MFDRLRKVGGTAELTDFVRRDLARVNMTLLHFVGIFLAVLAFVLLASSFMPMPPWNSRTPDAILAYRLGLIAYIVVCLLAAGVSTLIPGDHARTTRRQGFLLVSFIVCMVCIAMGITLYDYPATGSFFVYMVTLVLVFGLLYTPPLYTAVIVIASTFIMIFALYFMGYFDFVLRMTLYSYAFLVIVVSATSYRNRLRAAQANEEVLALSMRMQQQGAVDELTDLSTFAAFSESARTLLSSPHLVGARFSIVYLNIENMKIYNERHGMPAGDDLLVFVARTVQESFEHVLAARIGDDRFVLLTYGDDLIDGITRTHDAVRAYNGANVIVRAGVYAYDDQQVSLTTACDRAKLACDHIKGRYNDYYYVCNSALLAERDHRQFVLDRFEAAVYAGRVRPYYQPIVHAADKQVCEFEALARWDDPEEGLLGPDAFVGVLEDSRLVHHLDLCILDGACRDLRALLDAGLQPVPVNVNLSRYDLELCDIVAEVDRTLHEWSIPVKLVNIELTESAFAENSELLRNTITRFHEAGHAVWMDDFGSGYSSLNVLREFDFDVIKIDLQFLRHHSEVSRQRSRAMMPHIISLANELGVQVLAEGVEDQEQFDFLASIGCEKVQGFAFGKPLPFAEAKELFFGGRQGSERSAAGTQTAQV